MKSIRALCRHAWWCVSVSFVCLGCFVLAHANGLLGDQVALANSNPCDPPLLRCNGICYNPEIAICCNGNLYEKETPIGEVACCGSTFYFVEYENCCMSLDPTPVGTPYNKVTECCNCGKVLSGCQCAAP